MLAYEDNEEIFFKHNAKLKNNSGELIITSIRSIFISSSFSSSSKQQPNNKGIMNECINLCYSIHFLYVCMYV